MLLAIDTATNALGLALYDGNELLAEQVWRVGNQHNLLLVPAIEQLFDACRAHTSDLEAVAVAQGPGVYRHLRVGIATAKGIAVGAGIPLIGINTLDIIAAAQTFTNSRHHLFCTLQMSRNRIIAGEYRVKKGRWEAFGDPKITKWDDLLSDLNKALYYIAGEVDATGVDLINELNESDAVSLILVNVATRLRRAGFLAQVAWERYQDGESSDFSPEMVQAVYLDV